MVLLHTTNILTNIHTNIQLTYILTNILTNILKRVCGPRQAYRPGGSGAGLWGAADYEFIPMFIPNVFVFLYSSGKAKSTAASLLKLPCQVSDS